MRGHTARTDRDEIQHPDHGESKTTSVSLCPYTTTVAERYKPPMQADFISTVILYFSSLLEISLLRKINPSGEEKFG